MAIRLPDVVTITDYDDHLPCRFCVMDLAETDPDNMDRWVAHLTTYHGYRVVEDLSRAQTNRARTIRLQEVGWSDRAKFTPNQRVHVKSDSQPRDYAGRRGTVVGWNPRGTEYAVAFDEHPTLGWLDSATLEPFEANR